MILLYSGLLRQHIILCLFLGSSVQKRHGYTEANPEQDHENEEGEGESRGCKLGTEGSEGNLINAYKYLMWAVEKMESNFSQWYLNKRQEAMGTKLNTEFLFQCKDYSFFHCAGGQMMEQVVQRHYGVLILGNI